MNLLANTQVTVLGKGDVRFRVFERETYHEHRAVAGVFFL